jgi:TonB family protein
MEKLEECGRTLILALLGTIGAVRLLDAQYIRLGNAEAIPNGAIRPPTILKSTPALYTDAARTHGIEGTVTILAEVGRAGEIKYTRVLKGLGFGLDEAAIASVQEWALSPATRNGAPVEVVAQIDVEFRVEPQYMDGVRIAVHTGTIVVQAVVKKDGTVNIMRVVRGLPHGLPTMQFRR